MTGPSEQREWEAAALLRRINSVLDADESELPDFVSSLERYGVTIPADEMAALRATIALTERLRREVVEAVGAGRKGPASASLAGMTS
jgi:hypothetical protein